jgi:ABC-type branched-subunit amino acid transport system ATPase component
MSDCILQVENIGHSFEGFQALVDVNLSVPSTGITGLMGPNGSGKTTLFNIISGFLVPNTGRVLYRGRDIRGDSVQARSLAGLVRTFQTPKVFERLSVAENVMVGAYKTTRTGLFAGLLATPGSRAEIAATRELAYETCRKFDLAGMFDKEASLLAAGQRRLLELARAYQGSPVLLLLDEPSSGLTSTEIESLIEKLRLIAEEGTAILLVSHDMELMGITSIVNVLNFGRIIASAPMNEIKNNPDVREAYLGI